MTGGIRPGAFSTRQKKLAWALYLGLGVLTTGADLWTKAWAFDFLKVDMENFRLEKDRAGQTIVYIPYKTESGKPEPHAVISECFDLEASLNPGAIAGIFGRYTSGLAVLSFAAIIVITAILWAHLRKPTFDFSFVIALGLLVGGTAGNFYDRFQFGVVRDFIKWFVVLDAQPYVWPELHLVWPNFNLADSGICVGVCLLVLHLLLEGSGEAHKQEKPAA